MIDRITWTQREWRAVESALPYYWHTPTPAELDAAQRAALPADRHRPMVSFYGRINQAQYLYELRGARILNHAEALQRRIRLGELQTRLNDINIQLAAAYADLESAKKVKMDAYVAQHVAAPEDPATRIQFVEPAAAAAARQRRRIDIVGLIGMQRERVLEKLRAYPGVFQDVRFIDVDNVQKIDVSSTFAAVLVTRFISHAAEDRYNKVPVTRIGRPSAWRVANAVLEVYFANEGASS